MVKVNYIKLIVSIGLCLLAGVIGSLFTASAIPTWYALLNKPIFSPHNWIFGPVWTILYIMMGVSLYLVWTSKAKEKIKKKFYWVFAVQLFLNFLWSIIFFGQQSLFFALIEIILLWIAILYTILAAFKISKSAGWLLVPYILWVSFASVLNLAIYILN